MRYTEKMCVNVSSLTGSQMSAATTSDDRLAMIAHELRTPLAALSSAAELLARTAAGEPEIVRISEIVSRQAAAMRLLVEQLLDVSRVDAHRLNLQLSELDLCEVVRGAIADHREHIKRAGLRCHLIVAPRPVLVNGDAAKLVQVLGNVLSNAIKFTAAPGSIYVAVETIGNCACLRVRDTGAGIPADLLAVIFDRYRQENRGSFGGLGLGLPIAKSLVELHGGVIRASSEGPGQGCTIEIRLPSSRVRRTPPLRGPH